MHTFKSSLGKRFVRRDILLLEAMSLCLISATASAAVIVTTPTLSVPQTTAGIYVNLVTGVYSPSPSSAPGWDFNPFYSSSSGGINFFWSASMASGAGVIQMSGGPLLNLSPGVVVNSAAVFGQGAVNGGNFRKTQYGYAGLRFTNESTGIVDYGFVEMRTIGVTGFPATIMAYAYDDSGVPTTVESLEGIFISDFE
jgi:hypothetical protein